MAYIDSQLELSDAQAITTTAISTNVIDLAALRKGGSAAAGDIAFSRGVNQVRRELRRPRLRIVWDEVPLLMAWSPTVLPAASDWTHPDFTVTGAWHHPTPQDWQPPADLVEFLKYMSEINTANWPPNIEG